MIHKSHTKKDLIEIIDIFGFTDVCDNYKELNKDALIQLLDIHLRTIMEIKPNKNYFDFEGISDLQEYLRLPSPKQILTIKERDNIIDKCRKIIFYCYIAAYCIGPTTYATHEEIMEDALVIKKYGDIPTCRRALKLLKNDPQINAPEPVTTYRTQQRLDRKERLRMNSLSRISMNEGNFILNFS
tara:strand:+ start:106 stop:660 length:555 start_codon:yes stop_codon:yes gene_type:complete